MHLCSTEAAALMLFGAGYESSYLLTYLLSVEYRFDTPNVKVQKNSLLRNRECKT